jgi:hypothetical protein
LRRRGHDVHIERGDGYFYFWKGDANNWFDRPVNVPKVGSLTLERWIGEYDRLKNVNGECRKKPNATGEDVGRRNVWTLLGC